MTENNPVKKAYESILSHDFEQAIAWFEQAVAEHPDQAEIHYKLSITYARSGKLEKALEHASKACELDRRHEEYGYHLRNLQALELIRQAEQWLQKDERQAEMAIVLLRQAIRLDPLAAEGYLLLALAYARLNEVDQAIRAAREVLKLEPQHAAAGALLDELKQQLRQVLNAKKGNDADESGAID